MKKNPSRRKSSSRSFMPNPAWALGSAMVLSVVFSLQTRYSLADTNPPLGNPPTSNAYPTFTNLETKTDLVVGQNLKVGNSIKPKVGGSLTLDADKVNIKKDFEALGNGVVGGLESKGDLTADKNVKTNSILPYSGTSVAVGSDLVASGNVTISKDLTLTGLLKAATFHTTGGIWTSGDISTNKLDIAKINDIGLSQNYGSISGDGNGLMISSKGGKANVGIQGVNFGPTDVNGNATLSGGDMSLNFANIKTQGNMSIANNITAGGTVGAVNVNATGFLTAKFIGSWSAPTGPVLYVSGVNVNGVASVADCGIATLVSCSAQTSSSPSDVSVTSLSAGGKCYAYGSSKTAKTVNYLASAVCFNPAAKQN